MERKGIGMRSERERRRVGSKGGGRIEFSGG